MKVILVVYCGIEEVKRWEIFLYINVIFLDIEEFVIIVLVEVFKIIWEGS